MVKAKVLNVNSKNDIRFTFNGSNASNFSYSTYSKILTANITLKEGTNTIVFIDKSQVPANRWKYVTYGRICANYCPEKDDPNQK